MAATEGGEDAFRGKGIEATEGGHIQVMDTKTTKKPLLERKRLLL